MPENENDTGYDINDEETEQEYGLTDTGFDLEDEYKEDPLAPRGTYNGVVKHVEFLTKMNCIAWTVVAVQNSGILLLDGETLIDGTEYQFRNWLPKPGDEKIKSKNGKSTKRQTKINMLKKFQDVMDVDMNTPQAVSDALENSEWIGISVLMGISFNMYKGTTTNQIENMVRAEDDFELPEFGDEEGEETV
ncbi:MAG: hypothetical protein KAS32_01275 [Candidatus Peribacteraceae bacterium]|nr:hypothetical protein [Candidatus Peribacteraceae bacterium]